MKTLNETLDIINLETHQSSHSASNGTLTVTRFYLLPQLAQFCQKEMRKEAQRSQKVTQQTVPKARRMSREVRGCNVYP